MEEIWNIYIWIYKRNTCQWQTKIEDKVVRREKNTDLLKQTKASAARAMHVSGVMMAARKKTSRSASVKVCVWKTYQMYEVRETPDFKCKKVRKDICHTETFLLSNAFPFAKTCLDGQAVAAGGQSINLSVVAHNLI